MTRLAAGRLGNALGGVQEIGYLQGGLGKAGLPL